MNLHIMVLLFPVLLASCDKTSGAGSYSLIPGVGVGEFRINRVASKESRDLMLFKDESGKIEYIYTEVADYSIAVPEGRIYIGMDFDRVDKNGLKFDSATSDKLVGRWYVSKQGFVISVIDGKISGVGVCAP